MRISLFVGALLVGTFAAGSANATTTGFAGDLAPGHEVTPPTTTGHAPNGGAVFSYDDATKTLCGRIEYDDLTGPATGIHVHMAPKGMPDADGSATDKVIIPVAASPVTFKVVLPPAWETALMVGEIYANVHTETNSKGEIRATMDTWPEYPGGADPVVCPTTALVIGVPATDAGAEAGAATPPASTPAATPPSNNAETPSENTTDAPAPADGGGCSTAASNPASLASVALLAGLVLAAATSRRRSSRSREP